MLTVQGGAGKASRRMGKPTYLGKLDDGYALIAYQHGCTEPELLSDDAAAAQNIFFTRAV
jgi:hypothetical protein